MHSVDFSYDKYCDYRKKALQQNTAEIVSVTFLELRHKEKVSYTVKKGSAPADLTSPVGVLTPTSAAEAYTGA